jgi:acyl-CoA thioesterase-1
MKNYVLFVLPLVVLGCGGGGGGGASTDSAKPQATLTHDSARSATDDAGRTLTSDARQRTILFAGTSLTAGYGLDPDSAYPLLIQKMIDDARLPYTIINAGVSGETSAALLRRLDWLMRQPFDVMVIETGANDGLRGIPVEEMKSNVERVIARVRAARPSARIVLIQMEALPNLGASYTRRFREVFPDVARSARVDLLPFLLDGVAGKSELNQADGIHPNYAGERIVARNVWKGLKPLLP